MTEIGVRTATAADVPALTALWAAAFDPPLAPDAWLADPRHLANTVIAQLDGAVVGSVYGVMKLLREDAGAVARVHAIGSVAVSEAARGRGVARTLMTASLAEADRRGAEWSLLFTGTPGVYASSGYEQIRMNRSHLAAVWTGCEVPDSWRAGTDVVGVRPATRDVLAEVEPLLREARAGRVSMLALRENADLDVAAVRARGMTAVITPGAFALVRESDGRGVIEEIAWRRGAEGDAHAVLAAIADRFAAAGVSAVEVVIPDDASLVAVVAPFVPGLVAAPDETAMIRPLARVARLGALPIAWSALDYV